MKPLSDLALEALKKVAENPRPACTINGGILTRLKKEDLIGPLVLPSPLRMHKARTILHYQITAAGRALLSKEPK